MNLVSRSAWGARNPRSVSAIPGPVEGVSLHWEGVPLGATPHDQCDDGVRAIQRFHMDTRKWSDIAYNFVVCEHGSVFVARGWGVRSAANGTDRSNDRYHAVCFLGGEGDPFTAAAKAAIVALVAEGRRRYPQGLAVRPHSHFKATTCPGSVIRKWLVSDPFMPVPVPPAPTPTPPPQEDDDVKYRYTAPNREGIWVTDGWRLRRAATESVLRSIENTTVNLDDDPKWSAEEVAALHAWLVPVA